MQVVVIGAGITVCAVAYELPSRGAGVRVLDGRGIARAATAASAGVLCPHIEGHAAALRELGTAGLALYDGFVARVAADAGRGVKYRRSGTLEVALTDVEAEQLRLTAEAHARAGVEHRYLEPAEARALEPSLSDQISSKVYASCCRPPGMRRSAPSGSACARPRPTTCRPRPTTCRSSDPRPHTPACSSPPATIAMACSRRR